MYLYSSWGETTFNLSGTSWRGELRKSMHEYNICACFYQDLSANPGSHHLFRKPIKHRHWYRMNLMMVTSWQISVPMIHGWCQTRIYPWLSIVEHRTGWS